MPDRKQACFVEGKDYLPEELSRAGLPPEMIDRFTKPAGPYVRFNYCGFLASPSKVFVVLPKGQQVPADETRLYNRIFVLAGALLRYRAEGKMEDEEREMLGTEGSASTGSIATALLILQDYRRNGLLTRDRMIEQAGGKGRIHWPRTVSRCLPLLTGGQPVYVETVTRYRDRNTRNLVILLHEYVVKTCNRRFGWILDPRQRPDAETLPPLPCSIQQAVYTLKKELTSCFRDREIRLIKLLISYFTRTASQQNNISVETFGTPFFHNVWEAACCHAFRHNRDDLRLLPNPKWIRIEEGRRREEETRQIPDILFMKGGIRYVLDAKYYTTSRRLPGWGDLVKQFFYANTIGSLGRQDVETRNAMIFPGEHRGTTLHYLGYAILEGHPALGIIHGFSMDTFTTLQQYMTFKQSQARESLAAIWPRDYQNP